MIEDSEPRPLFPHFSRLQGSTAVPHWLSMGSRQRIKPKTQIFLCRLATYKGLFRVKTVDYG